MRIVRLISVIRRSYIMAKNTMNVIKGIGAGLAAGMIVGFAGTLMLGDTKKYKKKTAKAMGAAGELIDSVKEIFS